MRILLLSFGVVASLAVGGSRLQALLQSQAAPPTQTPPRRNRLRAYMCPMHPDVMSAAPGKCPRCNMDLVPGSPIAMPDFELHVETTPRVIKAGQPTKFRFTVHHPLTGAQAQATSR